MAPKMPRALSAATDDIGGGRYPRALLVSCASWVLLGIVLLIARVGYPTSTDAQETDRSTGVTAVRGPDADQGSWLPYLPAILGLLVLVLVVLMFVGQAWARIVLALLGLLAVVTLAVTATWLAVPAAVLFVVGAVTSVLVSSHRYLVQPRAGGPSDPQTTRVVS